MRIPRTIKLFMRNLCKKSQLFNACYVCASRLKTAHLRSFDDVKFAKEKYKESLYERCGIEKELNLENPQTFDEKLWWLKLNYHNPLATICSDKHRVREYVTECGLEHILNEQYGVYDKAEDIDFGTLPSPCFLKCNHVSGTNIIFDRTKPFDKEKFIKEFNKTLSENYFVKSREWNYKNIPPKIVAERVLRDENGDLPLDFKFLCFHGEPKLLFLDIDVCDQHGKHTKINYRNIYDMDFNLLDVSETREHKNTNIISKPINWDNMVGIARILSKDFPHCRVDLYNIEGNIYFGEITFYHGGGCNNIQPYEWDLKMGSWIKLDNLAIK